MIRRVREYFGHLLGAVLELVEAARRVADALVADVEEGLVARVDELERSRAIWEAEMQGQLMKATQERQNARNAEERTRSMAAKLAESSSDEELEELPEEYLRAIHGGDGDGSAPRGVQAVREAVGSSRQARKAALKRYKFGG